MYRRGKTISEERYKYEKENPSFSSTLLDNIYRSIDDQCYENNEDLKFFRETNIRRQNKNGGNRNKDRDVEKDMGSFRRACLIEKWIDKKVSEKVSTQRREQSSDFDRKVDYIENGYFDQDALFFSSTSISSDSSCGGFSSSDTESLYGTRPKAKGSCFAPPRAKPVQTKSVSARHEKTEKKQRTMLYDHKEYHMVDDYCHHNQVSNETQKIDESLIKSKSSASKIYNNLKKVKQPISPGGRLSSFINSLFFAGSAKKAKNPSSIASYSVGTCERKSKSVQALSTCSSASTFSRSCLSKNSPSTREKLRNGVKRTVRFYPVSVIVDEDCKPCGHKSLYDKNEEEDLSSLMAVSVPRAWKIGKSPTKKVEEENKGELLKRSRRVEEAAMEFLKEYRQNQMKNDLIRRDIGDFYFKDHDDDDVASDASSDLFELDHLAVIGNGKYQEHELPVYETTHVHKNLAINNGLIV